MKHPTVKRPARSWWARVKRAVWGWVDDLTGNEAWLDAGMPRTLDDFNQTRMR